MARKLNNVISALKADLQEQPKIRSIFITECTLWLDQHTKSPSRYLPILKQLALAFQLKVFKCQSLEGFQILILGNTLSTPFVMRIINRIIPAIEGDIRDNRHKFKYHSTHGHTLIANYRKELITRAAFKIQDWKIPSDIIGYEEYMQIKLTEYVKDNLKHKHLKKEIRASNRTQTPKIPRGKGKGN